LASTNVAQQANRIEGFKLGLDLLAARQSA
jgi:hypothetical protein